MDAQAFYLLAFSHPETAVSQSPQTIPGLKDSQTPKDAPYFQPVDIEVQTITQETIQIGKLAVAVRRQIYDELIQIVECLYPLTHVLQETAVSTRTQVEDTLRQRYLPPQNQQDELYEEYAALIIDQIEVTPDEFVERNAQALALYLRSQREVFSKQEIQDVLVSRLRYTDRDLTLVDWGGAIIIAPNGDFQSDIELMKIGNYQLLRYRLLDQAIEHSLQTISQNFQEGTRPSLLPNPSRRVLHDVIARRLSLVLDFERIDQNLLLIGDWYTAKLYQIILDEFYLDEWKSIVKSKLNNLESTSQIIQNNFTLSWSNFLDMVQLIGWLVLLVGYFVLFYLDTVAR